jgi:hypothetical protein
MTDRTFTDGTPARAIFSFGGGVQSHAVLALAAAGRVQYDAFVFANVGADSENPDTLAYLSSVTRPFCEQHGLNFVEVAKRNRAGAIVTLREQVMRSDIRSVVIPAYANGGGAVNRNCTNDWKILIVDRWLRAQRWPHVVVGLGISVDEWQRARDVNWYDREGPDRPLRFWKRREYPLLDLRLSRNDCHRLISDVGLPPVPKSSCYFCPFKRPGEWTELKATRPDLFEKAAELEDALNAKGLPRQYTLSTMKKPLREAVGDQAMLWPADDSCDSGYCWT